MSSQVKRKVADTNTSAAEWISPTKLTPWSRNPKPIEPRDVREMSRSIRRFGFGAPIVARRETLEVIEGHLRLAAAVSLKLEHVPVRLMDLEADESHLLAIAALRFEDRRTVDEDDVAQILRELVENDVDIVTGTSIDETQLDALLSGSSEMEDIVDDDDGKDKRGKSLKSELSYRIVIECEDESHQAIVMGKLESDGLSCRPLIS